MRVMTRLLLMILMGFTLVDCSYAAGGPRRAVYALLESARFSQRQSLVKIRATFI